MHLSVYVCSMSTQSPEKDIEGLPVLTWSRDSDSCPHIFYTTIALTD